MIADRIRTDAYCQALQRVVTSESVVLDIGTGVGIFALLACRFGARKVYAIEPSEAIQIARENAAANGFDDRIEFIQDLSTRTELRERANVVVSDIRGVLPLFGNHLPSIVDARERLLAPGGVLVPQRDSLWAAVVEAPQLYQRYMDPWLQNPYHLDLSAGRQIVTNTWAKTSGKRERFLTEPSCWATLDYRTIQHGSLSTEITATARDAGTAHGLSVWFDAELCDSITYSNSPIAPELIYGSAFFPFSEPVSVAPGDSITLSLAANRLGEDYMWRWNTRVLAQHDPLAVKAIFNQSTFLGTPLSPERLRKRAARYVPRLSQDGLIAQHVLSMADGLNTLDDVARSLIDRFPDRFATFRDALTHAGDLSAQYS